MFNMSFQQIIFKMSEIFYFLFFSTKLPAPDVCFLLYAASLFSLAVPPALSAAVV